MQLWPTHSMSKLFHLHPSCGWEWRIPPPVWDSGGPVQKPNFSPSMKSERMIQGFRTHPSDNGSGGGLIFCSLSPHLPDPASPQPAQQSERISVAPVRRRGAAGGGGVGGLEGKQRENQTKVVKRRSEGRWGGWRNNRRATDQILSNRMNANERGRVMWRGNRRGGDKMRIYMRWPVLWDKAGCCHFKNDCNKSDRQKMDLVILAC